MRIISNLLIILVFVLSFFYINCYAIEYDVSAKGKDENIAQKNAKVNAVRTSLKALASEQFLKNNLNSIRTEVILKHDYFVKSYVVKEINIHNNITQIEAKVDIDQSKLVDVLLKMNLDDDTKNKIKDLNLSTNQNEVTPSLAQTDNVKNNNENKLSETVATKSKDVTFFDSNSKKEKIELLINNPQKTLPNILSVSYEELLPEDIGNLLTLLVNSKLRNLYAYIEEESKNIFLASNIDQNKNLQDNLKMGVNNKMEFLEIIGVDKNKIKPENITKYNNTRILKTKYENVYKMENIHFTFMRNYIIVSTDPVVVNDIISSLNKESSLYVIDGNDDIFIRITTPQFTLNSSKESTLVTEVRLNECPEGWSWETKYNGAQIFDDNKKIRPQDNPNIKLYGSTTKPLSFISVGGSLLNVVYDILVKNENIKSERVTAVKNIISGLENVSLSLSNQSSKVYGIELPTAVVSINGTQPMVKDIINFFTEEDNILSQECKIEWENDDIAGWESVMRSKSIKSDRQNIPLELMIASNSNTIVLSNGKSEQVLNNFINIEDSLKLINNSKYSTQFSGDTSYINYIDIENLWKHFSKLLAKNEILRIMLRIDSILNSDQIEYFDHLLTITPPVKEIVGYGLSTEPTKSQGVIIIDKNKCQDFISTIIKIFKSVDK